MKLIGTQKLETNRLLLRRLKIEDYKEAFNNWYKDREVAEKSLWHEHKNEEETKEIFALWSDEYERDNTFRWIIELKETKELIGLIDSQQSRFEEYGAFEVGFCLTKKYWNNNYMTEALKEVIRFFMEEVEVNVVYAECTSDNIASKRVMEKANMYLEGTLKNRITDREYNIKDLLSYSITRDDYYERIVKR